MKNLKTFLFLGLITLFSSSAFAQDPHPTKFEVETDHSHARSRDNGGSAIQRAPINQQNGNLNQTDDNDSIYNLRDDWMDYYREVIFIGLF